MANKDDADEVGGLGLRRAFLVVKRRRARRRAEALRLRRERIQEKMIEREKLLGRPEPVVGVHPKLRKLVERQAEDDFEGES
jgi:hypothetical protein